MSQIIVKLPTLANWRTTLFGILTAIGAALVQLQQTGSITWQGAVACSLWAIFCYLVPDAKSNTDTQKQLTALLNAASGLQAQIPAPAVVARTEAPATDPVGIPSP